MRLPDFLGIGTQKGGTTFLHALLAQHPQVGLASPKEVHFFTLHYQRGADWYAGHFNDQGRELCCGEVTPYYLYHPCAAQRIQQLIPAVKLIVLLRDPVHRTLSHYFHSCRLGLETLDLAEALAAEPNRLVGADEILHQGGKHLSHQQHSYLARSRYEEQLVRYQQCFSSEQLLILRSEHLFQHPEQGWRKVLSFLELDDCPLPPRQVRYAGQGESALVPQIQKDQLRDVLAPTYRWLQQWGEGSSPG